MSEITNIELAHLDLGVEIEKLIEDRDRFRDDWKAMIIQIEDLTHERNRYKKLAKEFYPYAEIKADQVIVVDSNINDNDLNCADSKLHSWAIRFKQRIQNSMKSIARALNSIATAIDNLANALNPSKEKSTFIGKTPKIPYPKNPYMDIKENIDFSYNTYGSLSFSERQALYNIYKAIFNKGVNEPLHDKMLANLLNDLKRDWPSLHTAINSLVQSKTTINNKYSNKHYH